MAVFAAYKQNRFAAMDTCVGMIKGITDNKLGIRIGDVLQKYVDTFVSSIEPIDCKCQAVRNAIRSISKT